MTPLSSLPFQIGNIFRRRAYEQSFFPAKRDEFWKIVDIYDYDDGIYRTYEYIFIPWISSQQKWSTNLQSEVNHTLMQVQRYFRPVDRLTVLVLGLNYKKKSSPRSSEAGFLTDEDYF